MISVNDFMLKHKVSVDKMSTLTGVTTRTISDFKNEKNNRKPDKTFQFLLDRLDKEMEQDVSENIKSELNSEIMAVIEKHLKIATSLEDPEAMVAKLNIIIKYRKTFENLD